MITQKPEIEYKFRTNTLDYFEDLLQKFGWELVQLAGFHDATKSGIECGKYVELSIASLDEAYEYLVKPIPELASAYFIRDALGVTPEHKSKPVVSVDRPSVAKKAKKPLRKKAGKKKS